MTFATKYFGVLRITRDTLLLKNYSRVRFEFPFYAQNFATGHLIKQWQSL